MPPEAKYVLVIDDNTERRQMMAAVLGGGGFAVTAVAEGFSAIRVAGGQGYALAVVAMALPGMLDGAATARQIRASQPWLKVLFTGEAAERPRWPVGDSDDFIAAPFYRRDLLGCVFELLQRGNRQRSRAS